MTPMTPMTIIDTIHDRVIREYTKEEFMLDEMFNHQDRVALLESLETQEAVNHKQAKHNPMIYGLLLK